jgi:poly(glycerol-phosphate) alpha-glucosyltransferase
MEASALWALSRQEEHSIKQWGYSGRTVVIPNGVSRAEECSEAEITDFRVRNSVAPGSKILLYLGRITPKKNLPLLLEAFAAVRELAPEWVLVIAGSDEGDHLRIVQALIDKLDIRQNVRIVGRVAGREKALAFSAASVFVLPSHSEGLPIAVLEAMEYAKPVLITDGWSLPVGGDVRIGWRAPLNDDGFRQALSEALQAPEHELTALGEAGRELVRTHYDWDRIAQDAIELYDTVTREFSGLTAASAR